MELHHFSTALTLILFIYGYLNRSRYPFLFKAFIGFALFKFSVELTGTIQAHLGIANSPVYNIYTYLSFFFIAYVYYKVYNSSIGRTLVLLGSIFYVLLVIINLTLFEPFTSFNTNAVTTESLLIIVLALAYFYKLFAESQVVEIENHGMFWVSAGLLLYYSSNLFLFMTSGEIFAENPKYDLRKYWDLINAINNSVFNLALIIALWKARKQDLILA